MPCGGDKAAKAARASIGSSVRAVDETRAARRWPNPACNRACANAPQPPWLAHPVPQPGGTRRPKRRVSSPSGWFRKLLSLKQPAYRPPQSRGEEDEKRGEQKDKREGAGGRRREADRGRAGGGGRLHATVERAGPPQRRTDLLARFNRWAPHSKREGRGGRRTRRRDRMRERRHLSLKILGRNHSRRTVRAAIRWDESAVILGGERRALFWNSSCSRRLFSSRIILYRRRTSQEAARASLGAHRATGECTPRPRPTRRNRNGRGQLTPTPSAGAVGR